MSSESGWNKNVLGWDFADIALQNFPGWDRYKRDGKRKVPFAVWLTSIRGGGSESHKIAVKWDDISRGRFHYRDFTESSLPIVRSGEKYWSLFTFQFKRDAVKFLELYGGYGNWQHGYDKAFHEWQRSIGRCGCEKCMRELLANR